MRFAVVGVGDGLGVGAGGVAASSSAVVDSTVGGTDDTVSGGGDVGGTVYFGPVQYMSGFPGSGMHCGFGSVTGTGGAVVVGGHGSPTGFSSGGFQPSQGCFGVESTTWTMGAGVVGVAVVVVVNSGQVGSASGVPHQLYARWALIPTTQATANTNATRYLMYFLTAGPFC
jgi:hypothetical protein